MPGAGRRILRLQVVLATLLLPIATPAWSFQLGSRWSRTAASGTNLQQGDPTTVTWGLIDDGVQITRNGQIEAEQTSPSTLYAFLDTTFGSSDTWFPLIESSFQRWGQISGLTFQHEPNNSNSAINSIQNPIGSLNSVPDVRIGGHSIDGATGSNTLGYSYFPNHSDIVIDTDNGAYFGASGNNYVRFRNLMMHEIGHGLGIKHVESSNAAFLLEPVLSTAFDGPQLDDILAIQRLYGDAWEKGGGNNTFGTATPLGMLSDTLSIGTKGNSTSVSIDDVDFVSIDDNNDFDYFSFTIDVAKRLSVNLSPRGVTYNQGSEDGTQASFNAKSQSNLRLDVYDQNGTSVLASVNANGAGSGEAVDDLVLATAGQYYVRVAGSADTVQLYGLDLMAEDYFRAGDVNLDGLLSTGSGDPTTDDVAAFIAGWRTVLPTDDDITAWNKGDLDLNRVSDLNDWILLRNAFNETQNSAFALALASGTWAVPEPTSRMLSALAVAALIALRGRRRDPHLASTVSR